MNALFTLIHAIIPGKSTKVDYSIRYESENIFRISFCLPPKEYKNGFAIFANKGLSI